LASTATSLVQEPAFGVNPFRSISFINAPVVRLKILTVATEPALPWVLFLEIPRSALATISRFLPSSPRRVEKTDQEWKEILTPESYFVTRQRGTERAHSSEMCSLFEPGKYKCICCGTPLLTLRGNL